MRSTKASATSPAKPARRLLRFEVAEGRGLAKPKDRTCDTYVKTQLLDIAGRPIKTEVFTSTPAVKDSQSPKWNFGVDLGAAFDLNVDELPSVLVSVYQKAPALSLSTFGGGDVFLGSASVDLDNANDNVVEHGSWVKLEDNDPQAKQSPAKHASTHATPIQGEVRVTYRFTSPRLNADIESQREAGGIDLLKQEDEGEAADLRPNELHVAVLQARNLIAVDTSLISREKSSDPFVRLKLSGGDHSYERKKTRHINKNLNPVYNEVFVWSGVQDSSLTLNIAVKDKDTLGDKFMGSVDTPLSEYADKKCVKRWFKLLGQDGANDGKPRGEVQLQIYWKSSLVVLEKQNQALAKDQSAGFLSRLVRGKKEEFSDDEDEGHAESGDDDDNGPVDVKSPEELAKQKKEEEEILKKLADITISPGDYQVQVHIIEARDLKGENEDTTSNPVVSVECFEQKQHTRTVYSCNSCVFDEVLIFNMKNLDREQVLEGVVRVSCRSKGVTCNKMIGSYAFDVASVYQSSKDHEMHRQWVALMDDEDSSDVGVQGYLKISVAVLGPGDKPVFHDEQKELEAEQAAEIATGGDLTALVLSVPMIRKEWKYIVCTVYKCEDLPIMDGATGFQNAKTDAVCKLQIAGGKAFRTKTITTESPTRQGIRPQFNCELWYPFSVPSSTNLVKLAVYDRDTATYELIGVVVKKISDMKPGSGGGRSIDEEMKWYNIYGAPEFKTDGIAGNAKKLGGALRKGFKLAAGEADWFKYYNSVPDRGSCYKGRALLSFRIEKRRPPKYETPEVKPFLRSLITKSRDKEATALEVRRVEEKAVLLDDYCLQAIVICGAELPMFTSVSSMGGTQKLRVMICVGLHDLCTPEAKCEHGACRWNSSLSFDSLRLPRDASQIPDLFVYLIKEDRRPVCFRRIKASELLQVNGGGTNCFLQPAQWYLLQEDKSLDCLDEGDFPGTLLIKLAFGLKRDALKTEVKETWERSLKVCRSATPYQLRVHIYQGSDLPSADSNGLCDPFLHVSFMGRKLKSKTIYKTRYPAYYQTLVFNDVSIADADAFQYAAQINFRLFDQDATGTEYLGTFSYPLSKAVVTRDPDQPVKTLPDPSWFDFFREVPGDGQGKLLVLAQLIPTNGQVIPLPPEKPPIDHPMSIVPEARDAYIELICVGLRDLKPYNFQQMQSPFIDLFLESVGSSYEAKTRTSKLPTPSSPNFLEVITMLVKLPVKSIYATPINIRVSDVRLGGYAKPVVGVGAIDLSSKLPWCEDTYVPPGKDLFVENLQTQAIVSEIRRSSVAAPEPVDGITDPALKMKMEREQQRLLDDFVVSPQAPDVESILKSKVHEVDTGAGVFGALNHIKIDGGNGKSKEENAFTNPDWTEDDNEAPPAYMTGRRRLVGDLESELQSSPFETYNLYRGKTQGLFGKTIKVVGKFKGLIRVTVDHPSVDPMIPKDVLDLLLRPRPYKIRLYCLRASGLAKMDRNIDMSLAASDPYLRVKLGKFSFSDRENAVEDATDVDLYKCIEIDAELPGASQLVIDLMDKDLIGSDELIGSTIIDLEDRLFDARWQRLGEENKRVGGKEEEGRTVRWATKPVEARPLTVTNMTLPRGMLECFLDIMRPEEAVVFPLDDVSLPPRQTFQLRVVIWSARDVPPMDSFEGMSDLFVKVIPEGCAAQETDTHWRAKKGKASWNYRLLFDIELGHNTRAMKFPRLRLQLWDRDIVKWNDCAGETVLNMGPYYRKAFKKNVAIKLFEKKQGAAALRARKAAVRKPQTVVDRSDDIPPEENQSGDATAGASPASASPSSASVGVGVSVDDPSPPASQTPTSNPININAGNAGNASNASNSAAGLGGQSGGGDKVANADDTADPSAPLIKSKEEEQDEEDEELKEQVNMFKSMTGMWPDIDPPDSEWLKIGKKDHNSDKYDPMGAVSISVQIWPKAKATLMPVGAARNEPNTNPFLPPPVGRLKFSWNPFVLGTELCGPKICASLTCCIMCAAFVLLMIFCQPFLNIIINLVFVVCGA